MHHETDDLRIAALRPLLSPAILMEEFPISGGLSNVVANTRETTSAVIHGDDDRLIVVVGPCSIHSPRAALEYAGLLQPYHAKFAGELCIVMRVYFEKPRTTVGWKGLINDPDLNGSFNINSGLHQARKLLLDIGEIGLPVGSEFLDTIMPQFIADLISWGAIGARTTESQVHRELASGLSMPVGFKNATNGNVQVVADAIDAAKHRHHFLSVTKQGISAIVATSGNDSCHAILRGSTQGPNYDAESVRQTTALLTQAGVNPRVMIDCSHGNSAKDPERQPAIAQDIAAQVAGGSRDIIGVMLESNLLGGSQPLNDPSKLVYGQSITDACISWEQTVPILDELAQAVRQR
ncbi:MAG: 3-deoxy-7-phosphoheptulonate synthase, partial [Lentisphaeria bacterium]|nr:3-deoxy-7-phosphoheptulonate synthase [Lentisphaeria bacterium]